MRVPSLTVNLEAAPDVEGQVEDVAAVGRLHGNNGQAVQGARRVEADDAI